MLHKTINKVYVVTADTATSAYASCIEIFGVFSDELKAMGASAKIKKELGPQQMAYFENSILLNKLITFLKKNNNIA